MPELSLDPRKTALVAIDLQNMIVRSNPAPHSAAEVIENNRQIADALRAKGGTVVWVHVDIRQFLLLPVDQPPAYAGKELPDEFSQLVAENGVREADMVITKRHWGAFAGTPLELALKERGIETVVLTGISTNVGVESTLRQGTGLGFAFVVVEDACAAQDADEHRHSFEKTFPRLARVRTTEEVLNALA